MFKKILIGLAVVVIGFVMVVALQSPDLRVTRSGTISAPPATVFAQVNDLHSWEAWSPWIKLDPQSKNSYSGPASGVGASFAWAGNMSVGEGSMTITESRPNEFVKMRLDFVKPFKDTSTAEFTFKPEGEKTVVTWTMYGKKNFIAKGMGLFMDCDKMMGGFFEKGLAQMNTAVESAPKK